MKDPTLIEEENLPLIPTDDTDLKRQTFTADSRGGSKKSLPLISTDDTDLKRRGGDVAMLRLYDRDLGGGR